MKTRFTLMALWSMALILMAACMSLETRTASAVAHSGNIQRLEQRQDFDAARKAAPGYVRDANTTIIELEAEIKELKAK